MKILNEFGITPTRTHTAAGYDFYIPNIKTSVEDSGFILDAFSSSYKKSVDELKEIIDDLYLQVSAVYGEDRIMGNEMNVLMLYLALDSDWINQKSYDEKIDLFVDNWLIFDENNKPGIHPHLDDHVFFNSGIHTALDAGTAGIFYNKSGKGTKGWDVRACVVDEDYTGFVHLSLAYTQISGDGGDIYVGDKLIQMIILNVGQEEVEEIDKDMYQTLTEGSKRGSDGFGSSDVKH